jgi:CBS domain-containing protein
MTTAAEILRQKSTAFNYVHPQFNALEAIRLLSSLNRSFLVVMEEGEYKGIFTEHALVKKMATPGWQLAEKTVAEMMDTNLPAATMDSTRHEMMQLMIAHHTRYLPVFDGYRFAGVISMNNLLKVMLSPSLSFDEFFASPRGDFDAALQG